MQGILHRRRRARGAAWMVILWLVGVEVMPNAHLALHDEGTHTHDADGGLVVADDHEALSRLWFEHEHAVTDHHDREHEAGAPAQLAFDHVPARQHGAGGLAHHATALHQPPPPIVAPLPIAPAVVWSTRVLAARPTTTVLPAPSARGPPVTSAMSSCLS